jgi:hypothetical protein
MPELSQGATVRSVHELRPGLYRWTAPHPDWEPDQKPESPGDWDPDVGCVAWAGPDGLLLIDPLVDDWDALDALVERHGPTVHVATTLRFHARSRSRDEVVARYGARDSLPEGAEARPIERADETMLWLAEPRALVCGDRLMGDGRGGLRMCPESWLYYLRGSCTLDQLRAGLRPLLDLPIELVLVSHGEPVLSDGHAAIERALSP